MSVSECKGSLDATLGLTDVGAAALAYHYAYTIPAAATSGTDSAGVDGQVFTSAIDIPANCTLTGLSYLIGSVGGTDKAIAMLFDSAGTLLANSATAGVTVGSAATMQRLPFTAPVAIEGPGRYFVGIQYNGNTAKIRTQVWGDHPTAIDAQTFGVPANLGAVPTTFTTAYGPTVMTY